MCIPILVCSDAGPNTGILDLSNGTDGLERLFGGMVCFVSRFVALLRRCRSASSVRAGVCLCIVMWHFFAGLPAHLYVRAAIFSALFRDLRTAVRIFGAIPSFVWSRFCYSGTGFLSYLRQLCISSFAFSALMVLPLTLPDCILFLCPLRAASSLIQIFAAAGTLYLYSLAFTSPLPDCWIIRTAACVYRRRRFLFLNIPAPLLHSNVLRLPFLLFSLRWRWRGGFTISSTVIVWCAICLCRRVISSVSHISAFHHLVRPCGSLSSPTFCATRTGTVPFAMLAGHATVLRLHLTYRFLFFIRAAAFVTSGVPRYRAALIYLLMPFAAGRDAVVSLVFAPHAAARCARGYCVSILLSLVRHACARGGVA